MKPFKSLFTIAISAGIAFTSCSSENDIVQDNIQSFSKQDLLISSQKSGVLAKSTNPLNAILEINKSLGNYQIAQVEIYNKITTPEDINAITVIPIPDASSTEYRTGFRFVPNDSRRNNRTNLTYLTVSDFATSANGVPSEQIFDDMYNVWNNDSDCNNVAIDKQDFNLATDGLPSSILSFEGDPLGPIADNNIIGYIPEFLFEAIGASESTLAVTFTFAFRDENGNVTDLNNDGKTDTSHTEIWFNDAVTWSTDGAPGTTDVASVALHEFGHSVGLDHSGTLLASFDENGDFNGELQFSPTNVMNPSYIGIPKRDLAGDDNAIYCELFSAWPYY